MKKILSIITIVAAIAVVMTACKGNSTPGSSAVTYNDTAGLAQFQAWKAMNERMQYEAYMNATQSPVSNPSAKKSSAVKSGSMSSSSTHTAETAKKKGWSKAAKYAVIGGGSGAVLGAVINKRNRVAGGIIGGIFTGGLGYIFGRAQDKKDGRR